MQDLRVADDQEVHLHVARLSRHSERVHSDEVGSVAHARPAAVVDETDSWVPSYAVKRHLKPSSGKLLRVVPNINLCASVLYASVVCVSVVCACGRAKHQLVCECVVCGVCECVVHECCVCECFVCSVCECAVAHEAQVAQQQLQPKHLPA